MTVTEKVHTYSGHIDVRLVTDSFEFTQTITSASSQKITVEKVWDDDGIDHTNDSVAVSLTKDGTVVEGADSLTLNSDNSWTGAWSGLSLEEGEYSVAEVTVPGYTSTATSVTIGTSESTSNTVTVKGSLEITAINNTLTYTHNNTTYTTTGYSPQTDTKDGKTVYEYHFQNSAYSSGSQRGTTISLSDGDTITVVVTFKATYTVTDSEGNIIASETDKVFTNYTYTETVAYANNYCSQNGYDFYVYPDELLESIISEEVNTITVTNTPSTIDIPVTKVWSDGNENHSDETITVTLSGNDATYTAVLSASNDWTYTFVDLPKYDVSNSATGAKKIEYTVEEVAVSGYNSEVTYNNDGSVTITNTPSTTSITLQKIVKGNMGDYSKDFSFTVVDTDGNQYYNGGLSHNGGAITIDNVPIGATLTITEAASGYDSVTATVNSTTQAVTKNTDGSCSISFEVDAGDTIVFTNTKDAEIDTGVTLDSAPYIFLTVLALGGTVLLMKRRRVI